MTPMIRKNLIPLLAIALAACGAETDSDTTAATDTVEDDATQVVDRRPTTDTNTIDLEELDQQLADIIALRNLTSDPAAGRILPSITDPVPQLGMKLFFSTSLSGEFEVACASCHHPSLGGADALSLPVGVDARRPELLGPGRQHISGIPNVPRHSPTIFNIGLWDSGLFHDSRVESLGKEPLANGSVSGVRTPDTPFLEADANAGANLVAAQARFPVTSPEEMKSEQFEPDADGDTVRSHLAARIGNYGIGENSLAQNNWLFEFQLAYGTSEPAESLVTYDRIAQALAEYQRSMVFVDTAWHRYVQGDLQALTTQQKQGAFLFFTPVADGGAGCGACHRGPLLSDEQHHTVAFPAFGPGKGDGDQDDFGRERETGNPDDRYRVRTPSLLNIALTAPYGHGGVYRNLEEVVQHYVNPSRSVDDFFARGGACRLPQFNNLRDCENLYPQAEENSRLRLAKLQAEQDAGTSRLTSPDLDRAQVRQLVAFLRALTDRCAADQSCLKDWIPNSADGGPDGNQLSAVNRRGQRL